MPRNPLCRRALPQNGHHTIKRRCQAISNRDQLINEKIRAAEVRLVGAEGEQLGIMPRERAQALADSQNLDLVLIAPGAAPPVCRLMDYSKFKFEQSKREREQRKNQKIVEIKEIRMSLGIDVGDLNVKLKNAHKFLQAGDKVKVSIRFRGREMTHPQIGQQLMQRIIEACAELATAEKAPKMEGRNMTVMLNPKPVVTKREEKKSAQD